MAMVGHWMSGQRRPLYMPKTDRTKRPKCRWCGRTIHRSGTGPMRQKTWVHKHTGKFECSRQPMTASLHGKRVAQPPDGYEQVSMHRSLPITERDLKALNERVTELRRKMPDDEPSTILIRLQQGGEFLWADEAHMEGALVRLEEQTAQATPQARPTFEQLQEQAGELFSQALKIAEQAKALIAPTPDEMNEAVWMVNEMYSDVSEDRPDLGTADGLWDVLEQIMETRRAKREEGQGA